MITKEKLENFLYSAVEIEYTDGMIQKGWFVKRGRDYTLLPFDNIWITYNSKLSAIKRIKFLTNDFEIK